LQLRLAPAGGILGGIVNPFINRLRGLLAIGVAIWHVRGIAGVYPTTPDFFQTAMSPLIMFTGFNYVLCFIVLSGYCIARSTLTRGDNFSLTQYAVLRATRLYPSLIVCAGIAGIVEMIFLSSPFRVNVWNTGPTLDNFVASLFGISGFYGQFGSYAPTYTVSFELLFYLIWGIAFAYTPRKAVPVSLAAGVALYFMLPHNYSFALVLFASWLIGAALAVYEQEIVNIVAIVPLWAMWLAVSIAFIYGNQLALQLGVSIWSYPGSLVTIPGGLLFGIVIACHLSKNSKSMQMDEWLGDISYPLFLVHGPIMIAVASTLKVLDVNLGFGGMSAVLLGSSILAAQLVFIIVERPVMRIRRALANAPRRSAKAIGAMIGDCRSVAAATRATCAGWSTGRRS
jgi:peptidoglycan/LPS O-acetylase OafA/YrhL